MADNIDTSGRALVEHWKQIVAEDLMNSNTASALRSACSQVLECTDGWETLDIRSLDVDEAFLRFRKSRRADFKPQSIEQYRRRFAQAVEYFLDYVADPSGWTPPSRARSARVQPVAVSQQPSESVGKDPTPSHASRGESRTLEYPYPLKGDRMAALRLPIDITLAEVRRLSAFLATLAVDFEPGGD